MQRETVDPGKQDFRNDCKREEIRQMKLRKIQRLEKELEEL